MPPKTTEHETVAPVIERWGARDALECAAADPQGQKPDEAREEPKKRGCKRKAESDLRVLEFLRSQARHRADTNSDSRLFSPWTPETEEYHGSALEDIIEAAEEDEELHRELDEARADGCESE